MPWLLPLKENSFLLISHILKHDIIRGKGIIISVKEEENNDQE